ncbi:MAG: redoxin family protein [bacterium]|nr:redoxin family protein [bacterium]
MQIVDALFKFLALWGLWLFPAIILLSILGIVWLGRGRRLWIPATWKGRAGTAVLLVAMLISGALTALLAGPLDPLADGIRRFHRLQGEATADVAFRKVSDDAELSLHEFRGQVTVVNLWATWCPPCVQELPELDRLQRDYRDRGLAVVTLSQQERERLIAFAEKHDYDMTGVYAREVGWLDVADSRPVTVVLDRDGKLREFTVGARDYEGFEELVTPYLDG